MQLEQITRNHPRTAQERQTTYFVVEDLENLSASVLYSGDSEKYTDKYGGNISWGQSFGKSTDYIKKTELGELHVHAPKGFVTGSNLNGKPISNYEASIIDLLPGKVIKDTKKW